MLRVAVASPKDNGVEWLMEHKSEVYALFNIVYNNIYFDYKRKYKDTLKGWDLPISKEAREATERELNEDIKAKKTALKENNED